MQQGNSSLPRHLEKAIGHMSRGDGQKVVAECKKLLPHDKRNFDILHLMGIGYRLQKRYDRAIDFYLRALSVNPSGSATLFCNLAFAYLEDEDRNIFDAYDYAERARALSPGIQEVYEVCADVALRVGDPCSAVSFLEQGLDISPSSVSLWIKKSRAFRHAGLLNDALESVNKALKIDPSSPEVCYELGNVRELAGETEAAISAYQESLQLGHKSPEQVENQILATFMTHGKKDSLLARAQRVLKEEPNHNAAHLQLLRSGEYPGGALAGLDYFTKKKLNQRFMVEYAIAEGFDKEQNIIEGFKHYKRANKIKRQNTLEYSINRTIKHYQRIRNFYSKYSDTLLKPKEDADKYPTPIFVLGMPRSGTSLTEQLLGSHSHIHPAGELQYLLSLSKFGMSEFAGGKRQRTPDYWSWVRDTYLESLRKLSDGKPFVIDKMPHNYELIGFIGKLFPNSIIVSCVRNPMSNCLSIFKANFEGYHPYAHDLKTLAQYYVQYFDLMEFWKENANVPVIESSYEALVQNPRRQVEEILLSCKLEWQNQIEEFHLSDRIVRTASRDQVRQPIYTSSLQSWKAYESELKPMIKVFLDRGLLTNSDLE